MKVIVAARDTGGLKEVTFARNTFTSAPNGPQPNIETFNAEGLAKTITMLRSFTDSSGSKHLLAARKGGEIVCYSGQHPYLQEQRWPQSLLIDPSDMGPESSIVGLEYADGMVSWCTAAGRLYIQSLTVPSDRFSHQLVLDTSRNRCLSAFRMHPKQTGLVAFGGKEHDLEVQHSFKKRYGRLQEDIDELDGFSTPDRRYWKAKNVKNGSLDLRVPVWISDIRFLDVDRDASEGYRIVTSTRFGHIRIYETRMSRRPILNVEVGDHPLMGLCLGSCDKEIIFSDTQMTTAVFDLVNGRVGVKFKGSAGAVIAMDSSSAQNKSSTDTNTIVATGGLDRFLRMYDSSTGKNIAQIYLGTGINGISILDSQDEVDNKTSTAQTKKRQQHEDDDDEDSSNDDDDDDEDQEDKGDNDKEEEIWSKLEEKPPKKKRTRR